MYNIHAENSVKRMISSPLFLTGAIGYSTYVLFQLLSGIGGIGIGDQIRRLLQQSMYNADMEYYQTYINGYIMGQFLVQLIPLILIAVGIWMTFASAKAENHFVIKTSGVSLIYVITIIQFVCFCVFVLILEILCMCILADGGMWLEYSDVGFTIKGLLILVMVVSAIIAVIRIIYYVKLCSMIQRMKRTAITGIPDCRISLFVELYCYLAGGVEVISAFVSLSYLSVYGFLASAGLATANIAFGIFLRKYRDNMKIMENAGVNQQAAQQPAYQQAVQQPAYQQFSQQPYQISQPATVNKNVKVENSPYYNETAVLSGQLMNDGKEQLTRMTRQKTGETFCISKAVFWIGKEAANVDYCIADNSAISRRHALVTIQNNKCYIRDNRSTNGVFINGQIIQPDQDMILADGDKVCLGDEEFTVSIS